MKLFLKYTVTLISTLAAYPAFANWTQDFEVLKSIPKSYEVSGTICEEVARLDQIKKYPSPQYQVITGISYGTVNQVIGELDVVIFDVNANKAIQISEVKCWKDLADGLDKAYAQRDRFLKSLWSGKKLVFKSTTTNQTWSAEQFEEIEDFGTIGQKGAVDAGYTEELSYSLSEMHQHTQDMIKCQADGVCVRP